MSWENKDHYASCITFPIAVIIIQIISRLSWTFEASYLGGLIK